MNPPEMIGSDVDIDAEVEDPLALLDLWLARVGGPLEGTDVTTTPLMALATVDAAGFPRVRHVLLSAYDAAGLHFHTDARSAKSEQLAANPRAGATLVWPDIPRQLSVSGTVTPEPTPDAAVAYAHRSRYLQVLAWVNDPELTALTQAERVQRWEAFAAEHPELAPPATWRGYVLAPERITFWRGGPAGPSQRLACERDGTDWRIEKLPG